MMALEQIEGFDSAGSGWHAVNVGTDSRGLTRSTTYDSALDISVSCSIHSVESVYVEALLCLDPFSEWNAINVPGVQEYR